MLLRAGTVSSSCTEYSVSTRIHNKKLYKQIEDKSLLCGESQVKHKTNSKRSSISHGGDSVEKEPISGKLSKRTGF